MVSTIPLPKGNYDIYLHLAEIYYSGTGKRIFDVKVEDSLVFPNVDIYKDAGGKNVALIKNVADFSVNDGALTLEFIRMVQNPKYSAIEIHPRAPGIFVNAGGPSYTDPLGIVWEADIGYSNNTGNTYSTVGAIEGTNKQELYQTERYGADMIYTIPIDKGFYDISLHFAKIYGGAFGDGKRVFNVKMQGILVMENFDIFRKARNNTAYVITEPNLYVASTLKIEFVKIKQNPKLSAVKVRQAVTPQPSREPPMSVRPSEAPSILPSRSLFKAPSEEPSLVPSSMPSMEPSMRPSDIVSNEPSTDPTMRPSRSISGAPSDEPSLLWSTDSQHRAVRRTVGCHQQRTILGPLDATIELSIRSPK